MKRSLILLVVLAGGCAETSSQIRVGSSSATLPKAYDRISSVTYKETKPDGTKVEFEVKGVTNADPTAALMMNAEQQRQMLEKLDKLVDRIPLPR